MQVRELFTELKNIFTLSCNDVSKLATTRAISQISMKNWLKNDFSKNSRAFFSSVDAPNDPNLVVGQDWGNI